MSHKTPFATTTDWGIVQVGAGLTVTNGIVSTGGSPSPSLNYGFFLDTVSQTNPVANAINIVSFNTIGASNQISIVAGTQITVVNSGTYTKVFTVSLQKTTPGAPTNVTLWLRHNGIDVANSTQDIEVPNQTALLFVTGGFTLAMAAGDNIQLAWSCPDIAVQMAALPAQVGPVRPATASAKITFTRIS